MSHSLGSTRQHFDERTPIKLAGHQQRLRNCKKVFDQLHRTQLNTFIARKQHLQSLSSRTPDPLQIIKSIQGHSPFAQELRSKVKSQLKQVKQVGSVRKKSVETNLDVIRKMLQISGLKQKRDYSGFDLEEHRSGQQIFMFQRKRNQSNQSKGSTRVYRGSRILRNGEGKSWQKQIKDRKVYERKISQNPTVKYSNTEQNSQELKNGQKVSKKHSQQKSNYIKKSIEKRGRNNSQKLSCAGLNLSSYIRFIGAPEEIKELHIHFNFSPIRRMSSSEAWKSLDIKNGRMIEKLLDSILQVHIMLFRKNLQSSEKNLESIKDYCWLYFNNYEKAKLELILKQHYFKLFAFKLNPIFVFQRIALYFCFLLSQNGLINSTWYSSKMKSLIQLLKDIYSIILNVVQQIEQTKPTIKNIINATTSTQVEQTFQILRSVSQMEKKIGDLDIILHQILQNGAIEELNQINKVLRNFLKEEIFGIGKRTYENFIKTEMLLSWKYLQVPPTPFLPPIKSSYKYTIVLDLDETIIYYNQQSKILKFRPFLDTFLKKLEVMKYQIISFSASSKSYADAIIAQLQRKDQIFQYRLYKDHLSLYQGRLVKDLRRLGRDLSKTILIDDLNVNFSSCKDNGIQVSSWHGQKNDRQLVNILGVLMKIEKLEQQSKEVLPIQRDSVDIRDFLREDRKYLEKMLEHTESNEFLFNNQPQK